MAEFLITAPDGKKYKVTGATREGALAALKRKLNAAPQYDSFGDLLKQRGQQFAQGATEPFAGALEAAAIAGAGNPNAGANVVSETVQKAKEDLAALEKDYAERVAAWQEAGREVPEELTRRYKQQQFELREMIWGAVPGTGVGRKGLPSNESYLRAVTNGGEVNLKPDAQDRDLFKAGDALRQKSEEVFGKPQPNDQSFWAQVAQGGGTVAGMIAQGPLAIAGGSAMNSSQLYKEARDAGATEEDAKRAAELGALVGTTEIIPITRALKLLPPRLRKKIGSKFWKKAADIAQSSGEEGIQEYVTEVANNLIRQSIYDPERGWNEGAAESALVGAVIGGGVGTIGVTINNSLYTDDGNLKDPETLDDTQKRAAGDLARTFKAITDANPDWNLKDVDKTSATGARAVVDTAHVQLTEALKQRFADMKSRVKPNQADTFESVSQKIMAQAAYREGRNKTKNLVGNQELDALRSLAGDTREGQEAINLILQLNQLTELHNSGYQGGLSQFTDQFSIFGSKVGYDKGAVATERLLRPLLTGGAALQTGGLSLIGQAAASQGGRAIDKLTGNYSQIDKFVRRNVETPGLQQPTAPSLRDAAAAQLQADEDAKLREEALRTAREAEQRELNLQLVKEGAPATPGSPQYTLEDATGLSRDGVARILRILKAQNKNPALTRAIADYEQSVATGGIVEDKMLSPLIRAVRQFQQENPDYVPMVRPPNSLSNPMLATPAAPGQAPNVDTTEANPVQAQTFGPQLTTQENYNRGIEANIAMNRELVEGVTSDPELNRVQKGRLITSLDVLANNLGSDPVAAAQEQVQKLEEAGVPQEAIETYIQPYVDRVARQQAARVSPDEPILGSINPDIPAPTTVQTAALSAPTPVVHQQIDAPEGQTNHGLLPHLRVKAPAAREGKPLVLSGTNNKNASRQIDGIDEVLSRHEDPAGSPEAWSSMLGDALATDDVPVQPHGFIEDLNNGGAQELLSTLTPGQIADADHGFRNAAEFRQAYTNGEIGIEDTGRLFLWSFLSRGVSPYTQEGLFMDSFNGIEEWIRMAAGKSNRGTLADNIKDYEKWAKSAAPKGSGQPGAGATHNLNAFGNTFLMKMSQDAGKGDGRSRLQVIHDMMSDPNTTGKEVRREFLRMGEGVGIDNKVVSFTLLVAGYDDVMVLDRVQMRQMWNDGRFSGINLYDGYKSDGKPVTGSALSSLTYGARGLLVYEAMEKSLQNRLAQIYSDVGRPDAASVGRYHWETWVASSQQEASHGTIDAILKRAKGDPNPLEGVTAKEGEYGAYAYGARYGVENGVPMFTYEVPGHGEFKFTVPDFQKFLEDIKKPKNKVVPTKFKVTESGNAPWYTREGVNLDALAEKAKEHGKQIRTADAELQQGPTVPDGRTLDAPSGEPILGSRSPIESILSDTSPGANPDGPRPDVIPAEKPQVTAEQYKKAVVELIRPQFQIGLKGAELEDGISNFNDAVEFAKKLGIVVRLAMSQNELNTLLKLDTGQDPAKMGTFRGMFQRKGPKKKGKGTEGTIWAMKPGADKGDGTYVTDIEALTTLLHEISHAITLGPLDGKADQEVYSYFINRKQSSKPGTGIVGRSDFTAPGSFTDSAIKPLLDADWEQMSPTQKKAYAEIVDLQENVEAYSPKNSNERRAVRFIRQVMSNPGYSQETKQAYKDYTRMAAEFAVDPVWVYLINPKLAKKLMPVTSKMIQQEFRKANNKVIQFYAHPLAVVMAALVALEMAMDDDEERKQQQMPPGALNQPMMPGALSA